jgi:hypothetical protein
MFFPAGIPFVLVVGAVVYNAYLEQQRQAAAAAARAKK